LILSFCQVELVFSIVLGRIKMEGWVYIITNKAMPDVVKVGFTTNAPEERAAGLSHTGIPHAYVVEYAALVNHYRGVERKAHALLNECRENKNREWFRCDIGTAISAIRQAANGFIISESDGKKFELNNEVTMVANLNQQRIGKFIVQDGIATDTRTGLTWCRFLHGQTWKKGEVVGDAIRVTWREVFLIAEAFNQQGGYAGFKDWRLPTINELKTLIDKNKGEEENYIDADVFPDNDYCSWSASPVADNGRFAWRVDFFSGCAEQWGKNGKDSVRLVRNLD
jgi:hypothetical protein